jgi:formamidopyrimidine-DNA glycosylase
VPELPEVETIVRELQCQRVIGCRIERVILHWPGVIGKVAPRYFKRMLRLRRIESISRRAKYIVVGLEGGIWMLIHLRMTGRFCLEKAPGQSRTSVRMELLLDDGRALKFVDPRKFGRWELTCEPGRDLEKLGPEPLERDFTVAWLARRIKGCRRQIKPLLLDQSFLAGIGNIYADEALWSARIHPCCRALDLTHDEIKALHRAVRKVLRQGIRNRGTSLGAGKPNFKAPGGQQGGNQLFLNVFRRTGEPCPHCGTTIQRLVVAQRGTHVCPACQIRPSSPLCASR